MILSDSFRCPHSGQILIQDESSAHSENHSYDIIDGVPDFYVDAGGANSSEDANRKWLDAHAVEGRHLYYERCREWEGMDFCLDQISRLSHSHCRILEVGSGTGHFSRWMAEVCQPGSELYCFDYSWPCIDKTRTQLADSPGTHLFRANARGPMPFAPESFDIIFQRLAPFNAKGMERKEKDQRLLDLLAPGGHYVFAGWQDEYDGSCQVYLDNGFARAQHHRWQYPYELEAQEFVGGQMERGASRDEAEALLKEAQNKTNGLSILRKEHLFIAQKP
jgi:SAM-dependent methyltransferase